MVSDCRRTFKFWEKLLIDEYSFKAMGRLVQSNECKVNAMQYSGRQFISEFIKYAHKLDKFNVSFPV